MAMQTGMGLSRIIIVLGAGYTGTIILKNRKLSDILGELQALVKAWDKKGESSEDDYSDAVASQIRQLTEDIRQMASARPITVVNPSSHIVDISSLIVPAAALGALGYGYMWWKGLSFSDLMYVTKHSMTAAVSNLTKHLENVSKAVTVTKTYLMARMEKVDHKLIEQLELSKSIMDEVSGVQTEVLKVGSDLGDLHKIVYGLDLKIESLEDQQNVANRGILYLCNFIDGKKSKMPYMPQEQPKICGTSRVNLTSCGTDPNKGLKGFADFSVLGDGNGLLTVVAMQGSRDNFNGLPKKTPRMAVTNS